MNNKNYVLMRNRINRQIARICFLNSTAQGGGWGHFFPSDYRKLRKAPRRLQILAALQALITTNNQIFNISDSTPPSGLFIGKLLDQLY